MTTATSHMMNEQRGGHVLAAWIVAVCLFPAIYGVLCMLSIGPSFILYSIDSWSRQHSGPLMPTVLLIFFVVGLLGKLTCAAAIIMEIILVVRRNVSIRTKLIAGAFVLLAIMGNIWISTKGNNW